MLKEITQQESDYGDKLNVHVHALLQSGGENRNFCKLDVQSGHQMLHSSTTSCGDILLVRYLPPLVGHI